MNHTSFLAAALACLTISSVVGAQPSTPKRPAAKPASRTSAAPTPAANLEPAAKAVTYGPRDVVSVNTQLRFTTLVILPKDEVILDFVCGDKDLWSIEGQQNFAYIKPSTEGAKTNLNLVTESGNVYSFLLNEVSGTKNASADLKVFVEVKDAQMLAASALPKRLVSVKELDEAREAMEHAKAETRQVRAGAREAIDKGVSDFVTNVRFAYHFEAGKKPFNVRAMYHDEQFTYIRARPEETPTLYEIKDRRPNLVNFDYNEAGIYVIPKILDEGYLVIGKKRLPFKREE